MIQKDQGKVWLTCDRKGCDNTTEKFPSSAFHQMINRARHAGWFVFKRNGVFKHYCDFLHTKAIPEHDQ
jgi:hypothetical protein